MMRGVSIVVPTLGRPSLGVLLRRLAAQVPEAGPVELVIVRDHFARYQENAVPEELEPITRVIQGRGAGPAAARNAGWRQASYEWVSFLDDDVVPGDDWLAQLRHDLSVPAEIGGVQGRVSVPLPEGRAPTDWERNTHALSTSAWITADMAYRRAALEAVGGFDERFPRAFREDADLAYRVRLAGWRLAVGQRSICHPVRAESPWASLRAQRGNADDVLLRRKFGPAWRRKLHIPAGRRPRHLATALSGLAALAFAVRGNRKAAVLCGFSWLAGTAEFAYQRVRPGPGTAREVATMAVTSALIPPLATYHWCRGWLTTMRPPRNAARGAARSRRGR